MPAVSIIVPVYNVEKYLSQCLDSILAQTMKDFELICVNDGSPDKSQQILEAYAAKDSRIKVIRQENAGPSAARNTGVRAAVGEYIYYVDPDDAIEPTTLEIAMKNIEATQADILVFGMHDMLNNSANDEWFTRVSTPREAYYASFDPYCLLYEAGAFPFTWRNVYRRRMLLDNHIEYDESLRLGEDTVYQFTAFPFARRIHFIPDKLYRYRRMRRESLTKNAHEDMTKMISTHIEMCNNIISTWQRFNIWEKYGDKLFAWCLNFVAPDLNRVPESDRPALSRKMLDVLPSDEEIMLNDYDSNLLASLKKLAGRTDPDA